MAVEAPETTETDEQILRRWRDDVVAFAEEACVIKDPDGQVGPIRLFPHQQQWLAEADRRDSNGNLVHKRAIACWGKRDGKSLLVSILLAHRLFLYPETQSHILSNSERQGGTVLMTRLKEIADRSPVLAAMAPQTQTTRGRIPLLMSVQFHDARGQLVATSSVEVQPCNADTVQGIAIGPWSIFASDEVHAAQDPMAYRYLAAQCEAQNALTAVSSQAGPPVDDNPVWGLYQARKQPHVHWSYRSSPGTPWAQALAAIDKAELPPALYDRLWGNAWGATGQKLFTPMQVDACMSDYALPATAKIYEILREDWGITGTGGGLDRALAWARQGGGDNSVWTTVGRTTHLTAETQRMERTQRRQTAMSGERQGRRGGAQVPALQGDHYMVLQQDLLPTGAEHEVLTSVDRARQVFGVGNHIILEQYQAGDLLGKISGLTKDHLRSFTTQAQIPMWEQFYEIVAGGRLHFPADGSLEELREELLNITVDTMGALPKYQGKPHDDRVVSLLWAIEACGAGAIGFQAGDLYHAKSAGYVMDVA